MSRPKSLLPKPKQCESVSFTPKPELVEYLNKQLIETWTESECECLACSYEFEMVYEPGHALYFECPSCGEFEVVRV